LRSMNEFDIIRDMIPYKFVICSLILFLFLVPITTAFSSTESSIFEIQRLLNLTNTSLMRGDLDSSLETLDDAIDMVQELNEEEENIDNSGNDVSNGNGLEVESGNDETINDNGAIRGGIIDDNVERSQECVQNAKPGEVCALS
jgi:hypothetical protein